MAEIINLRAARKAKEKAETRAQADANAVKFGRRKGDKALEAARLAQEKRALDGHERE
ncbi:MAG: hypothetical protein ACD_54C01159G0003 [uncultured bacterium]|uniref:DUF4169 family protein n=1 Tax=Cypionkella sp. TaxID=2811411 RepID=UPI0002859E61|nr:DUF4169 family protein [Cypionkella sp.]EKD59757.1 MAG: hypothetical protein ACD_54C01159G0003 [uncultured bacterium]KAF0172495.1 MAG: hypothetical protein FD162_2327 [Paracoccaceae bacterium]MDO8327098.1 DUF4169 family protein [Cypionkella sp.]